jgi:hypothetical protein
MKTKLRIDPVHLPPQVRGFVLLLLFAISPMLIKAQITILKTSKRPEIAVEGAVYYDGWQTISIYREGAWRTLKGADPYAHHDLLYYRPLKAGGAGKVLKYYPDNYFLIYSFSSGSKCVSALDVKCIGKIMQLFKYDGIILLLDARPNIAADSRYLTAALPKHSPQWTPITIQGIQSYCLPRYAPRFEVYSDKVQFRDWGILSIDGDWLVEPKFDAPFRFQNGFAEVIYYGQKRKINEKGEFVE